MARRTRRRQRGGVVSLRKRNRPPPPPNAPPPNAPPPTWNALAEQNPPRTDPLPPGARHVTNVTVSPNVPTALWEQLRTEVMSIPIYLIACHSALCINYKNCGTPSRKTNMGTPTFIIPESTYILNFTSGGEYCLVNTEFSKRVKDNLAEFRKLLLLDNRADIRARKKEKKYSFVGSVVRAASGLQYPNINCTFHEDKDLVNTLGVFNVDDTETFTNDKSIIKDTELGPYNEEGDDKDSWYLDDIIDATYKRTGINKGIFLFSGCTSGFKQAKKMSNLKGNIGRAISDAETLFQLADVEYGTKVNGLNIERLKTIDPTLVPINRGFEWPIRQADPTTMAGLAAATGDKVEVLFPNILVRDPMNLQRALKMLGNSKG